MGIAERSGPQASPLGTLRNLNRHAELDEMGLSTVALRLPEYRVATISVPPGNVPCLKPLSWTSG